MNNSQNMPDYQNPQRRRKMRPKRSYFGLLAAGLVILFTLILLRRTHNSEEPWVIQGTVVTATMIRPLLIGSVVAAIASIAAFLGRIKWGYLLGSASMLIGLLQIPLQSLRRESAFLSILLLISFLFDFNSNYSKKER